MIDRELIERIREIKERNGYTLHDLSRRIDIQVSTLERWLKTGHINRIYAHVVKERLGIK
jgi:transcriptional regulator with XRE-family HTH domain